MLQIVIGRQLLISAVDRTTVNTGTIFQGGDIKKYQKFEIWKKYSNSVFKVYNFPHCIYDYCCPASSIIHEQGIQCNTMLPPSVSQDRLN